MFCNVVKFFSRQLSTTLVRCEVQKMTRLLVVDNTKMGQQANRNKKAKIIHVYNKTGIGKLGDRVKVAIQGQMKMGYLVGLSQKQAPNVARYDTNNVVLMEDEETPTGTRILVPIPSSLRSKEKFSKVLACATKFV